LNLHCFPDGACQGILVRYGISDGSAAQNSAALSQLVFNILVSPTARVNNDAG
jgi:hypothetical protein